MENSISQIHLLSVHLNAEKDSVIRNLEDIRAVHVCFLQNLR